MTDLLITVLLVGAAVTYLLETLDMISLGFVSKSTINKTLSLPLSVGGVYVMERQWSLEMIVTVTASTFVSLFLVRYLNKPQQVEVRRVPRI